jgi:long-chain fatty acid transport protein
MIMNMHRNRTGLKTALLLTLGVVMLHGAYADGYRNPPPTAAGIAKSGAHSVFVDDASAISYNPANLALQDDASLVIGTTFARTENTYTPPGSGVSFESDGDWNVLPNIYYSQPIGDKGFSLGIGITTPYGQGISWEGFSNLLNPPTVMTVPYDASVMMIDINPTAAMRIHDNVYVGVGIDIYYSILEMTAVNANPFPPPVTIDSKGEGDAWGIGANAGLTWLPTEGHRMTFTYRSRVDMDYKGDFEAGGTPLGDFEATVKYPNSVGVGYGIELSENVQIEALVEWLQWSVNDSQTIKTGSLGSQTLQNNWEDTFTFGLGGSWDATDWLIVRGGYAFLPSPIPDETITPLLPDADRHALSLGLGFALGEQHMIDLAYTYSIYSDRASPVTGATPGTYEIDSNLVGLTYSLSF